MGKFWQISTELRPLIDARNWFSLSIFGIFLSELWPLIYRLSLYRKYFLAGYDACPCSALIKTMILIAVFPKAIILSKMVILIDGLSKAILLKAALS